MSAPSPSFGRRRFLRIAAIHGAALAALRSGAADTRAPVAPLLTWRGVALGAEASIQLQAHTGAEADRLLQESRREIRRLESIFSLYDERSALSRLNRDGHLSNAPTELLELIAVARRGSELTGGAFDISIQPLCELLARGGAPDDEAIRRALALVDYRRIAHDSATVRFGRPGMRLTLNGLAQGYITDRVAGVLRRAGYSRLLVDIGEKRAVGCHPQGDPWRIGVESPFERGTLLDVVELDDRALATSGGYGGRYAEAGGRHHLLDARSGRSRHTWASVSVLAPAAMTADLLSTCLAVIDPSDAPRLLAQYPGTEARVVGADGRLGSVAAKPPPNHTTGGNAHLRSWRSFRAPKFPT